MHQQLYSTEIFEKLTPIYPYDSAADLQGRGFYSDEQVNFNFSQLLSGVADCKVNNFSNLFLTKKKKLSDFFTITPLEHTPNSFSTFFSFDAIEGTSQESFYWGVDESNDTGQTSIRTFIEKTPTPQNRNFFDISFIDNMLCKISHEHAGILRYLTLDYTFNLSFAVDAGLDALGVGSPQIFYYFYDKETDLMILYKKIFDFPYYATYNPFTRRIALRQPPTGSNHPYNLNGVMRLRPHSAPTSSYKLDDIRASYTKDFNVELNTADATVASNNFLVNTEYHDITDGHFNVNILSLKNELTPQNNNVQPSEYFTSDKYVSREYNRIFTGAPQLLGDDNISLSYTGKTNMLTFKADAITYFHVPGNIYPYKQLNVNDTDIARCGAVASDHPVKSDKIFKRRGAYKYTSPFGQSTDEANGVFLCSWLSAGVDCKTQPLWVDRYYNPMATTFLEALTSTNINTYITNFSTIVGTVCANTAFFDKPSDLYFEPGVYYAYHHIGTNDIQTYLKTLAPSVIQSGLVNYYVNNTQMYDRVEEVGEFSFDGQQYSTTVSLSSIIHNNRFTISVDLSVPKWTTPFANQFIGNFIKDGIGLFSATDITPFLCFFNLNNLYIYNTDGVLLDTVEFESNIASLSRERNVSDYYVTLDTGNVYRLTTKNTVIGEIIPPTPVGIIDSYHTDNTITMLVSTVSGRSVLDYTLDTSSVTTQTATTLSGVALSACYTTAKINDNIFCLPSSKLHVIGSDIYHMDNDIEIRKWDTVNNIDYPFFQTSVPIRDFNIDRFDNFWIATDSTLYAYTSARQEICNVLINTNGKVPVDVDFINEVTAAGQQNYAIVTTQSITPGDTSITVFRYLDTGIFHSSFTTDNLFPHLMAMQNTSNGDYVRRHSSGYSSDITAKIVVNNIINTNREEFTLTIPTSSMGTGYHNLVVRFDALRGDFACFVDGLKMDDIQFVPGQYTFSKTLDRPIVIGATPFYNSTLPQYLKQKNHYMVGCKLKNFCIYDDALNDSDIVAIANSSKTIPSIVYNMPAGIRSFVDEIERFFKLDVPINKAAHSAVCINVGNIPEELQKLLTARISAKLQNVLPVNTTASIKWVQTAEPYSDGST